MEIFHQVLDIFFQLDKHLGNIIEQHGALTYGILFMIIFIETGVVFMPFLPGDSLLFAAGMMAARYPDSLNIWLVIALLLIAAILGDGCNYLIGRRFGTKIQQISLFGKRMIKPEQLAQTHGFYEKYGASTIVIARFVPVVRTLAPFVGGVAAMNYSVFFKFNVIGAVLWVVSLSLAGYYLGSIPLVRDNFEKVVLGIVAVSVLPILWQLGKAKFKSISQSEVIV
ncbi:VTT domain-containing protein [Dyadobacter sp. LJ53]|uniref:VTT domain-containing protein n=1 Tax=Dyadobacter chenwenxiniae TaxID=2906456 RepID=UPI001F24184B|nr:VTT domain-containing protein [Dyadobacter chenwenxiniae]MCF0054112.1 VTT domain-containing protein [Dyadobacter chenwenxiniae]